MSFLFWLGGVHANYLAAGLQYCRYSAQETGANV